MTIMFEVIHQSLIEFGDFNRSLLNPQRCVLTGSLSGVGIGVRYTTSAILNPINVSPESVVSILAFLRPSEFRRFTFRK